jgi:hypothetical protein
MKTTMKLGTLVLLIGLVLSGCTSAFHNGQQMQVGAIKLTGLPSGVYAAGQKMAFSYNDGNGNWIHGTPALLSDPRWSADVAADGSWTLNFSPALVITTAQLQFLLIDPTMNWNTLKIDKKVSGKSGGDVYLDNKWDSRTWTLTGKVSGDDVTWDFE